MSRDNPSLYLWDCITDTSCLPSPPPGLTSKWTSSSSPALCWPAFLLEPSMPRTDSFLHASNSLKLFLRWRLNQRSGTLVVCSYLGNLKLKCVISTPPNSGHAGRAASDDQGELSLGAAIDPWGAQQSASSWSQRASVWGCDRGEDQGLHLPEDLQGLLWGARATAWPRNTGICCPKGQKGTSVPNHETPVSWSGHRIIDVVFTEMFWPLGLEEIQLQVITLTDACKAEVEPSSQENLPVWALLCLSLS